MNKPQSKQAQETKNGAANWFRSHKWVKRTVGIFIVLYIVSLFTPYVLGYTQFPLQVVRCGRLPVAASNFAAGYTYRVPGDKRYSDELTFVTNYYCSEKEAQAAGFRRNTFNY